MVDESVAVEDYKSTLTELTANSKPHINLLTMLAEEGHECASKIVQAIESHIKQVFWSWNFSMFYCNFCFVGPVQFCYELSILLFLVCILSDQKSSFLKFGTSTGFFYEVGSRNVRIKHRSILSVTGIS